MNLSFAGMDPGGLMSKANPIVAFSQLPEDQREKYLAASRSAERGSGRRGAVGRRLLGPGR